MEYKKYIGNTFKEARLKMLIDLGTSGYIISQKKVKIGGFLGFFRKEKVEITARAWNPLKVGMKKDTIPSDEKSSSSSNSTRKEKEEKIIQGVKREVDKIKKLLRNVIEKEKKITNKSSKKTISISDKNLKIVKMILKEDEFDEEFINILCNLPSIKKLIGKDISLKKIKRYLKKEIIQILNIKKGINLNEKGNVIFVIGPTGVGKTTTIAKIAAYFGVFEKKKVKMLSLDNYKMGSIQHLEFYGNIMNIPFSKIHTVQEFKKELELNLYDIVFIDTAGRNQKNDEEINEVKPFLNVIDRKKLYVTLVLSATTKYKDLIEILDRFEVLEYKSIIITKLDETNTMGPVLSAIRSKSKNLAYVTFGQNVPEDIEMESKDKLIENILKS